MTTPLMGVVKKLVSEKGFGFIKADGGVEYFFHKSEAPDFDELHVGSEVEFVPTVGEKGPRAGQVCRLS